ncbi:nonsense-mediated mRNA decay protein [Grosmannia clavigera kw1407]|uniref:Nonsense-mediated mRNA decay protein n=1 Tax=Grosmannia clavigera (strain kw1407 / UAMH 11150) TaxID=655863 RepID=F0X6S9_GROCL|nr:nonsense-mediated mRNA decay protein [Grosmannia clavigera kw1407]EFX06355.1 nonsense-mediated mRNA decay protein [Grosmannia clavigera kw1407]
MAAPQAVLSRKFNGVLPVPASATAVSTVPRAAAADATKPVKAKTAVEGDKFVIRRLPPGLTEDEFFTILGDEWKQGRGRVGWLSFHAGKISKDPSKPSRPAFAVLHVLRNEDLGLLSDVVRSASWVDAKESWTSPVLVGPPVAEFSLYKKVPSGKRRTDSRQGTIDQDAEFMAFLEALANPTSAKESAAAAANGTDGGQTATATNGAAGGALGEDDAAKTKTKVTSTPLIDFLREKKANKSKETANGKSGKQGRDKGRGSGTLDEPASSKKRAKGDKVDKADRDKERSGSGRSKASVKILTKKAIAEAAEAANNLAAAAAASAAGGVSASASGTGKEEMPKSRRAGILAAARILQRDLGLSPGLAHRKARAAAAQAAQTVGQADSDAPKVNGKTREKDSSSAVAAPDGHSPKTATGPAAATSAAATATAAGSKRTTRGTDENGPSSRGSRGKKGQGGDSGRGKAATANKGEVGASTPAKILLKKREDSSSGATATTTTTATATAATNGTAMAIPSAGPKAGAEKTKSTGTRRGGGGGTTGGAGGNGSGGASATTTTTTPTPGATRAFVKHANPSQGVTEVLLKEAMQVFGTVTHAEIDRRKGFAFVDFADHSSLVRAMEASPISVAQAAVQVLERKDREPKKSGAAQGSTAGVAAATTATASTSNAASASSATAAATPAGKPSDSVAGDKAPSVATTADGKRPARRRGVTGRVVRTCAGKERRGRTAWKKRREEGGGVSSELKADGWRQDVRNGQNGSNGSDGRQRWLHRNRALSRWWIEPDDSVAEHEHELWSTGLLLARLEVRNSR